MNKRDLEFLYEIGTLKSMKRFNQHVSLDTSSVAEHMYRVIWLALLVSRMEKAGDEAVIVKMAMAHDLAETRTSDLGYIQKVYVEADEDRALGDTFEGTSLQDYYNDVLKTYEARDSIEAKIVKDADNLDVDLELKEMAANGFAVPPEWGGFRRMIRDEKLYTESARQIWDQIQKSSIHDWHTKANKWLKLPNAGK
ncbi:MAG TPA: HD domain-containing protein [Patescibacteria group bacterium]|nr:HD domain-containing protein [Patescibacteria group bacterium]